MITIKTQFIMSAVRSVDLETHRVIENCEVEKCRQTELKVQKCSPSLMTSWSWPVSIIANFYEALDSWYSFPWHTHDTSWTRMMLISRLIIFDWTNTQERKLLLCFALPFEHIIALLSSCIFVSHKVNSRNSLRTKNLFYWYLNHWIFYRLNKRTSIEIIIILDQAHSKKVMIEIVKPE